MAVYDPLQLVSELLAAGLPVEGADATGRVQYTRDLTAAEQTTAQTIIAAHDPAKRDRDERTARETAKTYYTGLNAYLNLTNPTQAQTVAALKAVIRVLLWFLRNEFRT